MSLRFVVVEGLNFNAPTGEATDKPCELTVGNRKISVPPEYCTGRDIIATIEICPGGDEQPAEFLNCSEHARTFEAAMGGAAAKFGVPAKIRVGGLPCGAGADRPVRRMVGQGEECVGSL